MTLYTREQSRGQGRKVLSQSMERQATPACKTKKDAFPAGGSRACTHRVPGQRRSLSLRVQWPSSPRLSPRRDRTIRSILSAAGSVESAVLACHCTLRVPGAGM
jgi:hypothetical protein